MQFSIAAATTALLAGLAAASPTARGAGRVTLEFWAAADNTYTLSVPLDGSAAYLGSDLSFTSVSSWSPGGSTVCHAYGVDGSVTVLAGSQSGVPIGPPQQQVYATCVYGN